MHWRLERALEWGRDLVTDAALSLVTPKLALPAAIAARRVVFIGASVARAWRIHLVFPRIETRACYAFDKSELVRRAIADCPDAILIKECAAYFPADGVDRELVLRWLSQIRAGRIVPLLATVVPVTREHARAAPGRAPAIREFNDWLRETCAREGVALLDLEAALRVSAEDRHLAEPLAEPDGLHLPRATYRGRLDALIPPLLIGAFDR